MLICFPFLRVALLPAIEEPKVLFKSLIWRSQSFSQIIGFLSFTVTEFAVACTFSATFSALSSVTKTDVAVGPAASSP